MSETTFPAAPGTFLVIADQEAENGVLYEPIIGWRSVKATRALPITCKAHIDMVFGTGILIPGATPGESSVIDPTMGLTFTGLDQWLGFLSTAKPPEDEDYPRAALNVIFGDKVYKTASYWHFKSDEDQFLFEIEGGDPIPDDPRVTKTTRRDFKVVKKTMDVVSVDELTAEFEPTTTTKPNPPVAETEDEDDGMDLV